MNEDSGLNGFIERVTELPIDTGLLRRLIDPQMFVSVPPSNALAL
jgi:hypothetical protein